MNSGTGHGDASTTTCDACGCADKPIEECTWRITRCGSDGMLYLICRKPRIQLNCGGKRHFLVGWSEKTLSLWGKFLRLYGVHYVLRPSLRQSVRILSSKLLVGGIAGLVPGIAIAQGTGNSRWVASCLFIGFLDAISMALVELFLCTDRAETIKERFSPLIAGLTFAVFGVQAGIYSGVIGMIVCSVINGLIGWTVGKDLDRRIRDGVVGNQKQYEMDHLES